MSLIQCPECFKEVSDKAEVCLNCGFAVAKYVKKQQIIEQIKKEAEEEAYQYVKRIKREHDLKKMHAEIEEENRKNTIYNKALFDLKSEQIDSVVRAYNAFKSIIEWKDCRKQIEVCERKIEILNEKAQIKREKNRKRKKIITILGCVMVIIAFLTPTVIMPNINKAVAYNEAKKLLNNGQYDDAIKLFEFLDEYRASKKNILEAKYQKAKKLVDNGEYEKAITIFASLGNYADCKNQIDVTEYLWKVPYTPFDRLVERMV